MNKKFFTLLVAFLATISFGAFAQIDLTTDASGSFSSTKYYYFADANGNFLTVVPTSNGTKLVTMKGAAIGTYGTLNQAAWKVKVTKGTAAVAPTYVMENVATGAILALEGTLNSAGNNYNQGMNIVGEGKMADWLSTRIQTTAGKTKLYWVVPDKDEVNVLFSSSIADTDAGKYEHPAGSSTLVDYYAVVAQNKKAEDLAGLSTGYEFTPFEAKGMLPLSPNDLNTLFNTTGNLNGGQYVADKDMFFNLTFSDPQATYASPFTGQLQARAVEQKELKYAGDASKTADWVSAAYASMYPLGAEYKSDATVDANKDLNKSVSNTTAKWYALYSKDKDGYLVADTAYVPGTQQLNNGLLEIATDGLYNSKNNSRYRSPSSYLFQFLYNTSNNSIVIVSRGYVPGQDKDDRVKDNSNLTTYYTDFSFQPVKQGSQWGAVSYIGESGAITVTPQAPILVNDVTDIAATSVTTYAYGEVFLTPATLVTEVVYTLGKLKDDFVVTLNAAKGLNPKRITTGVYTVKLVKATTAALKQYEGKYLKYTLNGVFEWAEEATRQDFTKMPSAQWAIITTGSTTYPSSVFYNREFEDPAPSYLSGTTYAVDGNSMQFQYANGDTYELRTVDGKAERMGYKYVENPEFDLNRYEFRYLHELQMDRPVNTKADRDSAVWVETGDGSVTFELVQVVDDEYGYYNASYKSSIVQLKRVVYKAKVHTSSNFDYVGRFLAYDAVNKKYYLKESADNASTFLLKENNENGGEPYYIFLEANLYKNLVKASARVDISAGTALLPLQIGDKADYTVADNEMTFGIVKVSNVDYNNGYYYATEQNVRDEFGQIVKKWLPKVVVPGSYPVTNWATELANTSDDVKAFMSLYGLNTTTFLQMLSDGTLKPVAAIAPERKDDNTTENKKGYYFAWTFTNPAYASTKVSVNNNTLDLVNGVIADDANHEVNNSAFSVKQNETEWYRTLGKLENEENALNVVKFFRKNSDTAPENREYLYEDANSNYSGGVNEGTTIDNQLNFLGVEGKGFTTKPAMLVRYTSGDIMPQYLISVDEVEHAGTEGKVCEECGGADPNCPHNVEGTEGYITGRYLVNLTDSVKKYEDKKDPAMVTKFQWEGKYNRLAFVPGQLSLDGKKLTILNDPKVYDLTVNAHCPVLFSFRLLADNDEAYNFLIESESWKDNKPFNGNIAPQNGGWVKIQNGVPVIVNNDVSTESYDQSEIFNLEVTDETPTSNEGINNATVSVVAGEGFVTIKGAAGKQVVVANVLGQVVARQTLTSDEATIAAPAGVVVVSVEGAKAAKALVK